ncbi:AEC family transporter [Roseibium aestuarii]|uniref:AEC family transporter n=1 Tax=Roseibium aestuarii TaxID=2600299 RepID=A0ABW4K1I6_9HYPH|nr:AEC family transporter [Roseibium aestuarii]
MSLEILIIVAPVFILIGLGYIVARTGLLPQATGDALAQYVYVIAIPVLLFKTLAAVDMEGETPWALWASYFGGVFATWLLAAGLTRRLFARDARACAIAGTSASFANTVMVGLPLISAIYGDAGLTPLLLILSIHLPVMTILIAVIMERAAQADGVGEGGTLSSTVKNVLRSLATNPIVVGILAALVWRLAHLPVSGLMKDVLDRIAGTALPVALLSLGMSMVAYGIRGNLLPGILLSVLKVGIMPAIVFGLGAHVFHLPPLWTAAATLTAACPTGVNAYIFANKYGTGHAMSSNSITLTTLFAIATTSLWGGFLHLWGAG